MTKTKSRRPSRQESLSIFSGFVIVLLLVLVVIVVVVDGVRIHPNHRYNDYHQHRDASAAAAAADGAHRRLLFSSRAHVPSEEEVWAFENATTTFSAERRSRRTLKTVDVEQATSPQDHLVQNLPLLQDGTLNVEHWAGHLPASANGDKYFFYWLFAPDLGSSSDSSTTTTTISDDIPLLIWLNGRPGCSSMDGLFLKNGPLQWQPDPITKQYRLIANPYSWHKAPAYTLHIDQPVGTGLSFTTDPQGYPTNDEKVNIDFYYFLQSFLTLHADKFVSAAASATSSAGGHRLLRRPLYFSGESHAGHYIPSLIHYILTQNDNVNHESSSSSSNNIQIPVHGAAIGNGWMDPYHQYVAAEAAYGHGILGRAQVATLRHDEETCQAALLRKNYRHSGCFALLDNVVDESHGSSADTRIQCPCFRAQTSIT
jgi:carboxypeptidase D